MELEKVPLEYVITLATWKNNKGVFTNVFDAIEYANRYLHQYGPLPVDYKVGQLWDYSGFRDMIGVLKI